MKSRNPRARRAHLARVAGLVISICVALVFFSPHALAQVPRTFSYQGMLEENGQPATGTKQIQVALFDAATGGTQVWSETHANVTLTRGTFDLTLGSVSAIPQSLSFDKQFYIEVTVDGHTLSRTALASVPSAITASHAEMADGLSPNARGVVTSLNELTGGLKIVGDSTTSVTTVSQNPPTITIHSNLPAQGLLSVATGSPELSGTGLANDPVRLTSQGATQGMVLKWNGNNWTPAPDDGLTTVNAKSPELTGDGTLGKPITLDPQNATNGQALEWNGTSWSPATPYTSVTAQSPELTGNGTTNSPLALASQGATNGQALEWNGTNWVPTTPYTSVTTQSPELTGQGTAASPLKLAQQGATNGQVLQWNGSNWVPATSTVSTKSPELIGNGTVASPIAIAQQGATNGQALEWNGTNWVPTTPYTSVTAQSPELTGLGTVASPLKLAQQSATNGQVLQWNGSNWVPATPYTSVTAQSPELTGQGTVANPLKLAQQSATNGQVLQWNGINWVPATPYTSVTAQSPELTGQGTLASPLKLAQQSATNGQVLQWNGSNWVPTTPYTSVTAQSPELTGLGTVASPLKLAQQSATNGQVLQWNGSNWVPATPYTSVTARSPELTGLGTTASPLTLAQQGASTGQILKWNGSSWSPAADNSTVNVHSPELTGDGSTTNPVTLAQQSATSGQVLKWNGTSWSPAADNSTVNVHSPELTGDGSTTNPITLAQQGATTNQVLAWNGTSWTPTNAFNSVSVQSPELTGNGTTGNPIVLAQQGATNGQALLWNSANGDWQPGNVLSGSGTATQVAFWSGTVGSASSSLTSSSNLFWDNTNSRLGIGTGNTVSAALEVKSGNVLLSNAGTPGQLQLQGTGSGFSTIQAGAQGSTTINYTLPTTQPAINQILSATAVTGSGPYTVTLGWTGVNAVNAWNITGNNNVDDNVTNFLGTTNNVPMSIRVNNARAFRFEPGTSPNIVGGYSGNSANTTTLSMVGATIAGGGSAVFANKVLDNYGTVGGGVGNQAGVIATGLSNTTSDAEYATVSGGTNNSAFAALTFIGGGELNTAFDSLATIAGGLHNTASGFASSIGGGLNNLALGDYSTVSGGRLDSAAGWNATIGGGMLNRVRGYQSTIGGGESNAISGDSSTISGGAGNTINVWLLGASTIAGGVNNTINAAGWGTSISVTQDTWLGGSSATIGGGEGNSVLGQFGTIAGGLHNKVAQGATIAGGMGNYARSYIASIGGGYYDTAAGYWSTIAGGGENYTVGQGSTVSGGMYNSAGPIGNARTLMLTTGSADYTSEYATVAGGMYNVAAAYGSTVSGGVSDTSSLNYATVAGGYHNLATDTAATVSGGVSNFASRYSAIAGGRNLVLGHYSFGYNGDSLSTGLTDLSSTSHPELQHIAYFGNVNLAIGNVDSVARDLRFYSPQRSLTYTGPTSFYTAFKADTQTVNINYKLPGHQGAANTLLTNDGSGNLSWTTVSGATPAWYLAGNTGTTTWDGSTGTNFIGTTDAQPLAIATARSSGTMAQDIRFFTGTSGASERMRILGTGNIGINTTSPSQLFEVKSGNVLLSNAGTASQLQLQGTSTGTSSIEAGAQGATNIRYVLPSAGPTANNQVLAATNTTSPIQLGWQTPSGGSSGWNVTGGNAITTAGVGNEWIGTTTNQAFVIGTNSSERMRVSNTGNVGVNTASPTQLVEIKNGNMLLSNSGTAAQLQLQGTGTGVSTFQAGAQGATNLNYTLPAAYPTSNGYALVSTTGGTMSWADAAANAWKLQGNTGTTAGTNYIGTGDAVDLVFKTNATERARIINGAQPSLRLSSASSTATQLEFQNPAATQSSTFKAGTQSSTINYTWPTTQPSANQVLSASSITGGGPYNVTLSWANGGSGSGWGLTGNSSTTPGTNYIGTTDQQAWEVHIYNSDAGTSADGVGRVLRFDPIVGTGLNAGPNMIGGYHSNSVSTPYGYGGGTIVGGGSFSEPNQIQYDMSFIGGGSGNTAGDGGLTDLYVSWYNSIMGGESNSAKGTYGVVGGGLSNSIVYTNLGEVQAATIGGGNANSISLTGLPTGTLGNLFGYATIGGGQYNKISTRGDWSTIGGGAYDTITEAYATIAGGYYNQAKGRLAFVGGGVGNFANELDGVVAGGANNRLTGAADLTPGASVCSAIGGGIGNSISSFLGTIAGGAVNNISGPGSTISGGMFNSAPDSNSAIPGGGGLTLGAWSFGFNGDPRAFSINAGLTVNATSFPTDLHLFRSIAYFGNVDLWIGNVDGTPRALKFFAPNASQNYTGLGAGSYTSFQASALQGATPIIYTLPATAPTLTNTVLTANAAGTMSWSSASSLGGWTTTGNSGTIAGTNYLGTTDSVPFEIHVYHNGASARGFQRAIRIEPTDSCPNIIAGHNTNSIRSGVVGATISGGGTTYGPNKVLAAFGTVAGGELNTAGTGGATSLYGTSHATVGGGFNNSALHNFATIAGGTNNTSSDNFAAIGGGWTNSAGYSATVAGGGGNTASGGNATVGGGGANQATGSYATIAGGGYNIASGDLSVIGGGGGVFGNSGAGNIASGTQSVIAGGNTNHALGTSSVISGGANNIAFGSYATIAGGNYLTLGSNSFGFNVGGNTTNQVNLSAMSNVAYFGDVDLAIGTSTSTPRKLKFYAPNSLPDWTLATVKSTSFVAGSQATDINYTLPTALPGATGTVLAVSAIAGTGVSLGWASAASLGAWGTGGNSGTTAWNGATGNYLGTSDGTDLVFATNGREGWRLYNGGGVNVSLATTNAAKTTAFTLETVNNTATSLATSSGISKIALDVQSSGTWAATGTSPNIGVNVNTTGTAAKNVGLVVSASGATTNYAATFSGGNVGIGTTTPTNNLSVNGGVSVGTNAVAFTSLVSTYTATASDYVIFVSGAPALGATLTLPTAANRGQLITVIQTDANSNTVTVAAPTGQSIVNKNGVANTLAAQGVTIQYVADGSSTWYMISKF